MIQTEVHVFVQVYFTIPLYVFYQTVLKQQTADSENDLDTIFSLHPITDVRAVSVCVQLLPDGSVLSFNTHIL